tara:strand:- start:1552 stop:1746 length:195 start_codon:yes stop_codon:yes gene_type:complete
MEPFNPPRHVTTKVEERIIARNLFNSATSLLQGTQIHKVHKDSSGNTWRSVTIEYQGDALDGQL